MKKIYGMIHLSDVMPLERSLDEIKIFEDAGVHGIIVENYHGSTKDVINTLSKLNTNLEVGVNILPNEYDQSFQIAYDYGCSFIQMDFISGKYSSGRNYPSKELDVESYLEYRFRFPNVKVFGGVWPKYYQPVIGSSLEEDIRQGMKLCDAIVVTGSGTGKETPLDKIKNFRTILGNFPLIIGAGLTPDNISQMQYAQGAIVGSYFKPNGLTTSKVSKVLVDEFMKSLSS